LAPSNGHRLEPTSCENETTAADMTSEPLLQRALRFGRAVLVGGGATLADLSVFETCVRIIGMAPSAARLPALLTGACCQFFGNRSFTFRARAGSITRQAWLFLLAEAVTLGLNFGIFHLLVTTVQGAPPELLGFLGTFVTFVAFAYPVRRWVVFRTPT
jgi:putative flippase GtrA